MSDNRIKVAIVNYLNTAPFIQGIQEGPLSNDIELIECTPALCASLYHSGNVDLSLVPVGAMNPLIDRRVSDFGIASDGPVSSVCLLSQVPVEHISSVFLDYQSRTSAILIRILFDKFWKLKPAFVPAEPGYESNILGNKAGLVIGDRALELKSKFEYVYDLGQAWKAYSDLPFVYAVWLQSKILSTDFIQKFNQSLSQGVERIPALVMKHTLEDQIRLGKYFSENIRYRLTPRYDEGLNRFFRESKSLLMENNTGREKFKQEPA
jgi:chorismate dehydratase